MEIITALKERLEWKINFTLLAFLPNKINGTTQGPMMSSKTNVCGKRAIPTLAIIQGVGSYGQNDVQKCKCFSGCQKNIFL